MTGFRVFTVLPKVPKTLAFLQTLANNVWWAWNIDATSLFRRINPGLFKEAHFNPVELLSSVSQERLEELASDSSFLAHMRSVEAQFKTEVLTSKHWKDIADPHRCVAYFSMEFGLHESIHIYSGGLGILAGDHLKSASDLDVPICAIGILYREGYFEQELDISGHQVEAYPENDVHELPVTRAIGPNGAPVSISVPLPGGALHAAVWRLDVGRIPLFLLDTNVPENPPELRDVTGRLYGGDKLNRLRQELLLGIGGLRALDAMGFEVAVSHMNEGHAAFLGIERIAKTMRKGLSFVEAQEFVRRTSVFTTHTPVPAGNETFDMGLIYPHLKAIEDEGGVPADVTIAMGRAPGDKTSHELSMTILGLNCSAFSNGVAKLHGVVERNMWKHLWPDFPVEEVPISHVTNGVHVPTWISSDNFILYSSVLGSGWEKNTLSDSQLEKIENIRDEEVWRVHEGARAHLIRVAREHLEYSCMKRNAPIEELAAVRNVLDKDALTIGFARRFATYKRATLLLTDRERLKRLLLNPSRPVQIVFAGKAHPADSEGKHLIQQIADFAKDPELRRRIIFLENYNMHIARRLVRGVDVWLNTPRRPNEASGTSGMKACINGAIHVSTLDGWWPEGYDRSCGWAIGNGEEKADPQQQDVSDAQALYNLLESEIVPTFYDRPQGELPIRWISMMKASIKMSLNRFSSTRMVSDYFNNSYKPALDTYGKLSDDNFALVHSSVDRQNHILSRWGSIRVEFPVSDRDMTKNFVGDVFTVTSKVHLDGISPDDVTVEFFLGKIDQQSTVKDGAAIEMKLVGDLKNGDYLYSQTIKCPQAGAFGFSARVTPRSNELRTLMPGYMTWAALNN